MSFGIKYDQAHFKLNVFLFQRALVMQIHVDVIT